MLTEIKRKLSRMKGMEDVFKCDCGKIELERYAQPLSADPYCHAICRWCFDEAVLKGKPQPDDKTIEDDDECLICGSTSCIDRRT